MGRVAEAETVLHRGKKGGHAERSRGGATKGTGGGEEGSRQKEAGKAEMNTEKRARKKSARRYGTDQRGFEEMKSGADGAETKREGGFRGTLTRKSDRD